MCMLTIAMGRHTMFLRLLGRAVCKEQVQSALLHELIRSSFLEWRASQSLKLGKVEAYSSSISISAVCLFVLALDNAIALPFLQRSQ